MRNLVLLALLLSACNGAGGSTPDADGGDVSDGDTVPLARREQNALHPGPLEQRGIRVDLGADQQELGPLPASTVRDVHRGQRPQRAHAYRAGTRTKRPASRNTQQ